MTKSTTIGPSFVSFLWNPIGNNLITYPNKFPQIWSHHTCNVLILIKSLLPWICFQILENQFLFIAWFYFFLDHHLLLLSTKNKIKKINHYFLHVPKLFLCSFHTQHKWSSYPSRILLTRKNETYYPIAYPNLSKNEFKF